MGLKFDNIFLFVAAKMRKNNLQVGSKNKHTFFLQRHQFNSYKEKNLLEKVLAQPKVAVKQQNLLTLFKLPSSFRM